MAQTIWPTVSQYDTMLNCFSYIELYSIFTESQECYPTYPNVINITLCVWSILNNMFNPTHQSDGCPLWVIERPCSEMRSTNAGTVFRCVVQPGWSRRWFQQAVGGWYPTGNPQAHTYINQISVHINQKNWDSAHETRAVFRGSKHCSVFQLELKSTQTTQTSSERWLILGVG